MSDRAKGGVMEGEDLAIYLADCVIAYLCNSEEDNLAVADNERIVRVTVDVKGKETDLTLFWMQTDGKDTVIVGIDQKGVLWVDFLLLDLEKLKPNASLKSQSLYTIVDFDEYAPVACGLPWGHVLLSGIEPTELIEENIAAA